MIFRLIFYIKYYIIFIYEMKKENVFGQTLINNIECFSYTIVQVKHSKGEKYAGHL